MTEIQEILQQRFRWGLSSLADAGFLIIWIALQYAITKFISWLPPDSILDRGIFLVFQVLFAVSTLAPIVIFIYGDIVKMMVRTRKEIMQEEESRT